MDLIVPTRHQQANGALHRTAQFEAHGIDICPDQPGAIHNHIVGLAAQRRQHFDRHPLERILDHAGVEARQGLQHPARMVRIRIADFQGQVAAIGDHGLQPVHDQARPLRGARPTQQDRAATLLR